MIKAGSIMKANEDRDGIYGLHAVAAALAAGELAELWVVPERHDDARVKVLVDRAQAMALPVVETRSGDLARKVGSDKHQGVGGLLCPLPTLDLPTLLAGLEGKAPALFLILDGVLDPHNLGACLRSAEGAGVTAVLLPKDNACPVNATVRKVAAGSASRLPVIPVTNLARTLGLLQEHGFWVVGMAGEGDKSLYELDLRGPMVMIMGGEEKGLRRLTRAHCDFLAHIPMEGRGGSLNVSVATGICLFEAYRQRHGVGCGVGTGRLPGEGE
ncbi:MAG: 23S rRNA (guanosine(2251)-2'-O)-methyltransferase RlmB [Acidithiobacillus sp.]